MIANAIDIHAHIVPSVDDGARSAVEAYQLLDKAQSQRIGIIVATPHINDHAADDNITSIIQAVKRFCHVASNDTITILPGAEVMVRPDLVDLICKHPQLMLNRGQRYVLVELPLTTLPIYAERALFEVQARGWVPIIAHPERYAFVQRDPNWLWQLLRNGALGQVTADSITLPRSHPIRRTAEILVKHSMVHVIASDAHSLSERPFRLWEAVDIVRRWVGERDAVAMVTDVPRSILADEPINVEPQRYRRFWGLLWRSKEIK